METSIQAVKPACWLQSQGHCFTRLGTISCTIHLRANQPWRAKGKTTKLSPAKAPSAECMRWGQFGTLKKKPWYKQRWRDGWISVKCVLTVEEAHVWPCILPPCRYIIAVERSWKCRETAVTCHPLDNGVLEGRCAPYPQKTSQQSECFSYFGFFGYKVGMIFSRRGPC